MDVYLAQAFHFYTWNTRNAMKHADFQLVHILPLFASTPIISDIVVCRIPYACQSSIVRHKTNMGKAMNAACHHKS
jgi:hypothetical protein